MRWKNWSDFEGQDSVNFREENWQTIKTLFMNFRTKQKLQNEVDCMNDSRDFKDAESVRSGLSHVTSQPALLPLFRDFEILAKCSAVLWQCQASTRSRQTVATRTVCRETFFVNPTVSSSSTYPQKSNPWVSNVSQHTSPHVMSDSQTPAQDQRWQSGPSARNSVIPCEGDFSKTYGADQQRLQISDLHFDKFPNPATFACWKIRFKTEVCTCSKFPTEAMQWIKEVEMVESVDDLKSSRFIKGTLGPDFEVLDARIASALNRIIQNTRFKKKVSLEEQKAQKKRTVSLRGRQIAFLVWEYFRVTGADDSVENYAGLFTAVLRNDDLQEFDSKWDGIPLSMTQIPSDQILESLYKLRTRVSEKLKTVKELYNVEIHQKKSGPDHHRLKTMEKRSIEQNLRMSNLEARNGNYYTSTVVKNQGTKQRGQRSLADCWQWKAEGAVFGRRQLQFPTRYQWACKKQHSRILLGALLRGRMREMHREPEKSWRQKPKWENGRLPCKNYLKWTCTTPFCEKWHPPECWFYKSESGCKFGDECSYAHRQVDEQPSRRSQKNGNRIAVAFVKNTRHFCCVFQDMEPPKSSSILRKSSTIPKPIRRVRFTKTVMHFADIRDTKLSLGVICPSDPHQRNPKHQNLRIDLKKRQSGKSDLHVKPRGKWQDVPRS